MKARRVLAALLMAFALVSIGFALGKEMTFRRLRAADGQVGTAPAGRPNRVVLYYMHPALRCVTCNEMQKAIENLVRTEFAEPLADGRLEWKEVNFQQDDSLARRYNVSSSSLVVVAFRDGREAGHQTLEQIWTVKDSPDELRSLVREAIRSRLSGVAQ